MIRMARSVSVLCGSNCKSKRSTALSFFGRISVILVQNNPALSASSLNRSPSMSGRITQNRPFSVSRFFTDSNKSPCGSFTVCRTLVLSCVADSVPPEKNGGLQTA